MSTNVGGTCLIHGSYFGLMCPSCNAAPALQAQPWQNAEAVGLHRVAAALERIATALETATPSTVGDELLKLSALWETFFNREQGEPS